MSSVRSRPAVVSWLPCQLAREASLDGARLGMFVLRLALGSDLREPILDSLLQRVTAFLKDASFQLSR